MANRGYELYTESNEASSGYVLAYYGKVREVMSAYLFDETKSLSRINMAFEGNVLNELRTHLTNDLQYQFLFDDEGDYYYSLPDGKSFALVYVTTLSNGSYATYIVFLPMPSSSRSAKVPRLQKTVGKNVEVLNLENIRNALLFKKYGKKARIMR
jgi:hypothetical protein